MTFLQHFVGTQMAAALGWTVLDSLWEGAVVSALLALTLYAIRSPRLRYAAACAAMLLLAGAFVFTFAHTMPESPHGRTSQLLPIIPSTDPPAPAPDTWEPALSAIVPWVTPFWMLGVLVFSARNLAGLAMVHKMRRRGVCSAPERWQSELGRLAARVRVSRQVGLLESCIADVPLVLGYFRPLILLPIGLLTRLPAGQIEAILLHELVHIRRHDYLINVLQRAAEALLFYHPAAWWISKVMRVEREHCCDDLVVQIRGDAHEYAVALTALEENRRFKYESAVAATGGTLVNRVRRLLQPQTSNTPWTAAFAAGILIIAVFVTAAAWQPALAQESANPQSSAAAASKYAKWIDQDVVYIITDRERTAFNKLTTDEERDHFIQQFWERRNPVPGSPENNFKREHYRRLAYVNEHYASSIPGWRTDRGRIYIVYGPPDEIDSHPRRESGSLPYEFWLYRYVDGIGNNVTITFVDKNGTGDYQMAPGKNR